MEGQNEVFLQGYLKYPKVRETANGFLQFQGKIAVPGRYIDKQSGEEKVGSSFVKVCAWGDIARELATLPEDTPLRVQGTYKERSYDGNCKNCGHPEKKYWTDVQINNFEILGG